MKQVARAGFLLALVAFAAGCGGKKVEEDVVTQPPPPPPKPPVVEEKPVEPPPKIDPLSLRDVYFDYDKSDIRADARAILDDAARQLKDHADKSIVIEGHCDERGTVEYNLALGQRRAHATLQYLVRKGVAASRVSVISYGEERPVDRGHTESAWAKNRRAHFVVQG